MMSTTIADCAHALLLNWVAHFSMLWHPTSDHGSHFTSALWASMAFTLSVNLHSTSSHHPQNNTVVERFHWSLKASL